MNNLESPQWVPMKRPRRRARWVLLVFLAPVVPLAWALFVVLDSPRRFVKWWAQSAFVLWDIHRSPAIRAAALDVGLYLGEAMPVGDEPE